MEKENLCGQMTVLMKENFYKTIFTDLVNMNGKMVEFTKVNGKITKWKVKELLLGQTVGNTLEIMCKIVKRVSEYLHSKMAEFMKDNGLMENSTVEEYLKRKTFLAREYGKMESE